MNRQKPFRTRRQGWSAVLAGIGTTSLLSGSLLMGMAGQASATGDDEDDGVRICHATGSDKNPYVLIPPSSAGKANGHLKHDDDIIPPFEYKGETHSLNWDSEGKEIWEDDCEVDDDDDNGKDDDDNGKDDDDNGKDDDDDDRVRICHATGSEKNPYVSITVSTAGAAQGHLKHDDDIIPPFEYKDEDFSLNWDSEGKEIWEDDCEAKDDDDDDGKDDDEEEVTAVKPTVKQSEECEVEGSFTIPDTEGVEYFLDGEEIEEGTYSGPISGTITAEADGDDYELTNEDFEFELDIEPAEECPEPRDVCPNIEGIQTSVPQGLTLNSQGNCVGPEVAGTESPSPKPTPTKPPKVTPHQPTDVPTAVNAGLGGNGPASGGSAEGLLAQALIGGGLLLLLTAGGLQVGRRTSGAHQV